MTSYRRHGRTPLQCEVKVNRDDFGEVLAEACDVSETGMFIKCKALIGKINVGEALSAKLCPESECESPSLFTVVRLTDDGIGLTYA